MDTAVDTHAQAPCWHDEKSFSPKPNSRDNESDDILLDTYFDHSQPLDSSALDALLETNFEDDAESTSTKAIAAKWRTAHSGATSQPQQLSTTKMEPLDYLASAASHEQLPSSHGYLTSRSRMYGLPVNAASAYQGFTMGMHPPSPYDQHAMTHQNHQMPLGEVPTRFSQGQYFANPSPVALPTMNDLYHDTASQVQHSDYQSSDNASCRNTADLMDYDNAIPEEDEAGGNVNGENSDPCYAQLLYKCFKEAPDHTMTLKNVYEWVRQHSQKARDSSGTGWQNSVRHNLSMNAAFERVTSSTLHGPKKGSLWRLTNQALQEGHVISTTRYRKDPKRKPERRSSPALKRQISGAKGGQATRAASAHRRAMLARHSGTHNPNGIKHYRRGPLNQEAPFFAPSSMPGSNRATASPQPGWMPHGMAQQVSLPPSPYYLPSTETEQFAMLPPQSLSNPHTPTEIQIGYAAPPKALASPSTAFGSPSKGLLTEFELSYHDHAMGSLFGNHDGFEPNTPSLGTEMSFATDEMTPVSMRMSLSVEPSRS